MNAKKGEIIDHINGDKLDNRRENLRICTNSQNIRSRHTKPIGKSDFYGVSYDKNHNSWISQAIVDGKCYYFGRFSTDIEAAYKRNIELDKIGDKYTTRNIFTEDQVNFIKSLGDIGTVGDKNRKSKYRNIYYNKLKNKWRYEIMIKGNRYSKNDFDTEDEAHEALINSPYYQQKYGTSAS